MAETDLDTLLDQFAAVNERDFPRAMSHYTEDVVLTVDPDAFLDGGTFEGKEAVGEWFGNWFRTFEPGYRFEVEETRQLGDRILMVASHEGRGRGSGAEVHGRTGYLYGFRDGKIASVELYRDAETAIAAGGGSGRGGN